MKGDYLRKDVELPEASSGDLLVIHETGGYCMALYSKFNSILPRYHHISHLFMDVPQDSYK